MYLGLLVSDIIWTGAATSRSSRQPSYLVVNSRFKPLEYKREFTGNRTLVTK